MPKVTDAHVQARRFQILGATCICVAQKGFHHTTMQDICRTADLSPGAIYSYFSSKEAIIKSLAEDGLRKNEAWFVELKQKGDVREALSDFSKMVFSCLEQAQTECYTAPAMHRVKVGLWAEAIRNPDVLELFEHNYKATRGELAEIVREGQERGEVRATLDPKAVAQVFISLLEGFVLQKALDPSVDSTNYLEALDAFLDCSFWRRS